MAKKKVVAKNVAPRPDESPVDEVKHKHLKESRWMYCHETGKSSIFNPGDTIPDSFRDTPKPD